MLAYLQKKLYLCALFIWITINIKIDMATNQQNTGALYNALTSGSKIIGTIITDSDIRVDGTIEGDVKCSGKMVIGEQGLVKGTVECQSAEIMGTLDGKINVKYTLALRATSRLKGEINTQTLMVEPNAIFNGSCTMGNDSDKEKTDNLKSQK
jgi:cytoskeletal protein CcmA (bactofilin family)